MLATDAGCMESVELLLNNGADLSIESHGLTALEMAAKSDHEDIVDLLQMTKLSLSSAPSPVLTANEIANNIDDGNLALHYRAIEKMHVEKAEIFITADEYHKHKGTALPQYEEGSVTIY